MTIAGYARLSCCISALVLSACGAPPKTTFYTLSPVAQVAAAAQTDVPAAYTVAIGPVRVPEVVDRPQIVVRQGANQIDIVEQHRWAQPLRAEIAQAISAALAARLPQARVALDKDTAGLNADYRVSLDVKRFEFMPGEKVLMEAFWTIRPGTGKTPVAGQSIVSEAVNGDSYDEMAAAFSRGLMQTGKEIAAGIESFQAGAAAPVK